MSRHQKIGKKHREKANKRIRVACVGGGLVLDLLNLVSSMRHRSRGETYDVLKVVEDNLQKIRGEMAKSVPPPTKITLKELSSSDPLSPQVKNETDISGDEWTTQETKILEEYYAKGKGVENCLKYLDGRSRGAIIEMARKLGLATSKERYTKMEIENIIAGKFDKLPGRSLAALKTKRSRLFAIKKIETE